MGSVCVVFCPLIRHQLYWNPEIQPACFDRLRGISVDERIINVLFAVMFRKFD